jgi:hypothetical protein
MWGHDLLFAMGEEMMDFLPWCDPTPLEVTLEAVLANAHLSAQTNVRPRGWMGVRKDNILKKNWRLKKLI